MSVTQWVTGAPAPELRPFVARYIGYRLLGQRPGLHRGLPSPNMTLIFSIGRTIDVVAQTNPRHDPRRYRAVLGGLHDSPALIAHDCNQEGVAVQLSPLGSRTLLGLPAAELWHLTLEVDEVAGPEGAELCERLHDTEDWSRRFSACDRVLVGMVRERTVAPELARAWETLVRTGGRVAVGELATDVGYTRQHLRHRFTQEFGLGPKRAARLIRFNRAAALLMRESAPDLSRVAVTCGYYDQAHMHRDFASLAGCTPTEFVAGDLPFIQVQDVPAR
ncbi:MAG TPA: helix-turn-helix domain-containing protein [Acidimicrobiia bacterium]|nr:helix-turn-helix domain-containing protein [Acidimicrobiia bacterium]